MSLILLNKKLEEKKEIKFKLIIKRISKVLRKKLMLSLNRVDGRTNTGRIATYHRGGVIKKGIV